MMGIGLICSYSRGSWLGTLVGLLYLAKVYGKFKWRMIMLGILVVGATVWSFWDATPDSTPWYIKRMDFGRPSAQHRVAAWRGAMEMIRDHPLGVGWNHAEEWYEKDYSPPKDGALAITTNDYLMMGTQLGLPALFCFIAYIWLAFRRGVKARCRTSISSVTCHFPVRAASRAGTLGMLVVFWLDSGLFRLPSAATFWILVELGEMF
jgi:O-antigen ligase